MVNWIGITVGVHYSDDGNIQLIGFFYCGDLPTHVHYVDQVGDIAHFFDAPQPVIVFLDLALQTQGLFLRQTIEVTPVTAGL